MPDIRKIAKEIGRHHRLSFELWKSGIPEARILASMLCDPEKITGKQMDSWAGAFDAWDVCDQVCMNLFHRTPLAWQKVFLWSGHSKEFVKRAAFSLIAVLAVHDKVSGDAVFRKAFPLIKRASTDERNFVKKAVNWALRGMGKRNPNLQKSAIACARSLIASKSKSARWIAADALRELEGR